MPTKRRLLNYADQRELLCENQAKDFKLGDLQRRLRSRGLMLRLRRHGASLTQ